MNSYLKKWWGWGDPCKRIPLETYPLFFDFLVSRFHIKNKTSVHPQEESIALPSSHLMSSEIKYLQNIVGTENFFQDHATRFYHSLGKSTSDLIAARRATRTEAQAPRVYSPPTPH